MTEKTLSSLASCDINSSLSHELKDIGSIEVNKALPLDERLDDFICQIKNPYLFKSGDLTVKVRMKESGAQFKSALLRSLFPERNNLPD